MHNSSQAHSSPPASSGSGNTTPSGPFNTFIQRSRPYLTEEQIEAAKPTDSAVEAKDLATRLSACGWIMQVGSSLQFPVRTMATAMILYHRFRLFNRSPYFEPNYVDTAAASLFVACKIEDTLKKSREILATSYNIRHPQNDPISPDAAILDEQTKRIIGIERMILESSSFDFRNRHAFPFVVKFSKRLGCSEKVAKRAWDISVDIYKTMAPLKAVPHALALAALDLAMRLEEERVELKYEAFEVSGEIVWATMDDLLELYLNQKGYTTLANYFDSNTYLTIRIELNKQRNLLLSNGNGKAHEKTNGHSSSLNSPSSPAERTLAYLSNGYLVNTDRGTHGTIRFMLDGEREREERRLLGKLDGGEKENEHINGGGQNKDGGSEHKPTNGRSIVRS